MAKRKKRLSMTKAAKAARRRKRIAAAAGYASVMAHANAKRVRRSAKRKKSRTGNKRSAIIVMRNLSLKEIRAVKKALRR